MDGQSGLPIKLGRLYLTGYGLSEPAVFFARLHAHAIDVALDIRLNPHGRVPEYTGQVFLDALVSAGGVRRARWVPRLASATLSREEPPKLVDPTAVDDLVNVLAQGKKVALVCACFRSETCHRRLIAEQVRGRLPAVEIIRLDRPFPRREPRPKLAASAQVPRTEIGVELEQRLARTALLGVPSIEITEHFTAAVSVWAAEHGWLAIPEMTLPFLVDTPSAPGRAGRVDLYVARPGEKKDLVIEIDRNDKTWSAEKLRLAADSGYAVLWVRWGRESSLRRPSALPPEVEFVPVPLAAEPHAQRAVSVMARLDSSSAEQLRAVAARLAGSEHALLVGLVAVTGLAGLTDVQPGGLWSLVDAHLNERLGAVLGLRYGRQGPALTLVAVAQRLAASSGQPAVSRERIRQLETKALRSLNRRVRIRRAGLEPSRPKREARPRDGGTEQPSLPAPGNEAVPGLPVDLGTLASLVCEVHAATGPISLALTAYVLRGSRGPMTRALVAEKQPPHVGELASVNVRSLIVALSDIASSGRATFGSSETRTLSSAS